MVLGKVHWTALQPRAPAFPPDTGMGEQYLSNHSLLPQAMSSLTTGGTAASTSSPAYSPLPVQAAYTPAITYASVRDQPTAPSQQGQPALSSYSALATQSSHQMQASSPRSSGYTWSNPQYTPYVSTSPSFSDHAAQGNQVPYTSMPQSSSGSDHFAVTSNLPALTDESSYVAKDPSDENYTLYSNVSKPYGPPPQETQPAWHTASPNEAHKRTEYSQDKIDDFNNSEFQNGKVTGLDYLSHEQPVNARHKHYLQDEKQQHQSETHNQPEQQVTRRDNFYATVPQWKYDH
jgi:hypothetical protein